MSFEYQFYFIKYKSERLFETQHRKHVYGSWKHKYGNIKPVEHAMQEYDRQLPKRNPQMLPLKKTIQRPVPVPHQQYRRDYSQHGMIKLGDWTSPSVIDTLIQVCC